MPLVPLHVISGYSLLQSGLTIDTIKEQLVSKNFSGCAITDYGSLSGIPPLFEALEKANKKPLVGLSIGLNGDILSLIAISEKGYQNISKVSSLLQKGESITDYLLSSHDDVIGIIETVRGTFYQRFNKDDVNKIDFTSYVNVYSKLVDKFYLGLEITSIEEMSYANKVREFATSHSYQTIAFPRIRYADKSDAIIIDIVEAIRNNTKLEEKSKDGLEYFMEHKYYEKLYKKEEISLTEEILNSSTFNFHQKRGKILSFPVENKTGFLKESVLNGLKNLNKTSEEYISRMEHELNVISSLGYEDYFLIVQDYVRFAKTHNIVVGPGRGSAAGSLVSYALGITEIDPLMYNLQFERFLNAARKTMPDIDIDFMDRKRNNMVKYMIDKWGKDKVAVIITFQTIKAKQSLRDIGRIYSFPEEHISLLCKTLTDDKYDLRTSYKKIPAFKDLVDDNAYFLNIVKLAKKIEGLPRNSSLHAAGIILNNESLEESIPINVDPNDGSYITQYEAEYLEEQGFLKMDFLALSNLTVIDDCVNLINATTNDKLDSMHIPYNTKETYETISKRKTAGIFQLESKGMNQAIAKIRPTCLEDVALCLGIFRPGPMAEIDEFCRRRNGGKFTYESKELEEILSDTYGIIIYQEQINAVATKVAGFSKEEADIFRRGVSKKDKTIFPKNREKFISGAINNGYSKEVATSIFNKITKFEDYGFNKSHAVAYAMIASTMSYLKTKYPLQFYSAILNSKASVNDTKFNNYLRELHTIGYKILPPDINESSKVFEIRENGLLFPLTNIKNVSDMFVDTLLAERSNNGKFKSFFDLVLRMSNKGLTPAVTQKLINSGALDIFGHNRKSLEYATVGAFQHAKLYEGKDGQMILSDELIPEMVIREADDDPLEKLTKEYETIWMTLSSNPLEVIRDRLNAQGVQKIFEIDDKNAVFAGIIRDKKIIKTRKDRRQMAYLTLYDETGECEVVVFSDLFEKVSINIDKNTPILVKGYKRRERNNLLDEEEVSSYIANEIEPINLNE